MSVGGASLAYEAGPCNYKRPCVGGGCFAIRYGATLIVPSMPAWIMQSYE